MPLSSHLAPGFIRVRYSGATVPHNQTIPIKFVGTPTPGVLPDLSTSSGGTVDMETAVLAWLLAFRECFAASTTFGFAECYAVDPTTGVRTFIWSMNTGGNAGLSVDPQVDLVEGVWVFKTTAGKPLKIYAMEGVFAADVRNIGTVPSDGRADVIAYVTGDDNIFYGRTDAWPLAFMTFTSKENDVLRRASLLPAV